MIRPERNTSLCPERLNGKSDKVFGIKADKKNDSVLIHTVTQCSEGDS